MLVKYIWIESTGIKNNVSRNLLAEFTPTCIVFELKMYLVEKIRMELESRFTLMGQLLHQLQTHEARCLLKCLKSNAFNSLLVPT